MKRLALILAILLTLALPAVALAAGPLDDINVEVSTWLTTANAYQSSYYQAHYTYQQVLWSHTIAPSVSTAPDNLLARPDDQIATGQDFWLGANLPAATAYRVRVDVYNGPAGPGYVVILEAVVSGQSWLKMINVGPETWRSTEWFGQDEL